MEVPKAIGILLVTTVSSGGQPSIVTVTVLVAATAEMPEAKIRAVIEDFISTSKAVKSVGIPKYRNECRMSRRR